MYRKILTIITSEEIIVATLALVLLSFSYGPLVYQYLFPPLGKVFTGSFGFPMDFLGNLAVYQEGRIGQWAVTVPLTSTLPIPSLYHKEIYILIGQFSRIFPIDGVIFFHIVRFLLSVGLVITSYIFITKIFTTKAQRIGALTLAFFSTAVTLGSGQYDKLSNVWSPLAVFQRSSYFYHYTAAFILTLIIILLLAGFLTSKKRNKFILASILGFCATFIHPANSASLVLTLPVFIILDAWQNKKISRGKIFSLGLFSVIALSPMLYFYLSGQSYPMNTLSKFDLMFDIGKYISPLELLLGIGPTMILGAFGGWLALKEKRALILLIIPWSIVYILGFFFLGRFSGFNSSRFLQTPFYIFLGILSVYPLWRLSKGRIGVFYFLIVLTLSLSVFSFKSSLRENLNVDNRQVYPWINSDPQIPEALSWLRENTKPSQVVLSNELNGSFIWSYAGNLTYLNSSTEQVAGYSGLSYKSLLFFAERFSEAEAKNFLEKENISFIFNEKPLAYPFLKLIFSNSKIVIYKANWN